MNNQNEPRRSRRLTTIVPGSHWMSIGYSYHDAKSMENLMKDLKNYCKEFEEGIDCDVKLRSRYPGIPVPYHETMLPLWKRFSKALMIYNADEDFNVLDMYRIYMDIQVARVLSDAIMYNHPHLKKVKLQKCGLSNTSLLRTFLAGCSRIETIALEGNGIGSEGASAIAEFIGDNHPVEQQVIRLANNNLSDGDMIAFASALKLNTHMFFMDLSENDLTEQGWKVIQKAVFDLTSLNSLVDCNHTCMIWNFGDTDAIMRNNGNDIPDLELELMFIVGDGEEEDLSIHRLKKKIRKKVVLALCGVDRQHFDLSHLNDLPFQLMPRVLELIQEHTIVRKEHHKYGNKKLEKEALSRLLHILREWHLPLLFDNLHDLPTRRSKRKRGVSSR